MTLFYDVPQMRDPSLYSSWRRPNHNSIIDWTHPVANWRPTGVFLMGWPNPLKNLNPAFPDLSVFGFNFDEWGRDAYLPGNFNFQCTMDDSLVGGIATMGAGSWSLFVIADAQKTPISSNDQNFWSTSTTNAMMYFDNLGTAGRLTSFDGSKIAITSPEPNFNAGVFESYATTFNHTNDDQWLYLNGGTMCGGAQTNGTQSGFNSAMSGNVDIFDDMGGTSKRIQARFRCMFVFDQTLPAHIIASMHKDPFGFLIPNG